MRYKNMGNYYPLCGHNIRTEGDVMLVDVKPPCHAVAFMLPFPFLCVGCFCSKSAKIVLDNSSQMIEIESYPGYLFCCKSYDSYQYADIQKFDCRETNTTVNEETIPNNQKSRSDNLSRMSPLPMTARKTHANDESSPMKLVQCYIRCRFFIEMLHNT